MILFFGPPGSGKSLHGQLVATNNGMRWLSAGQLLRDMKDPKIAEIMQSGTLVSGETMNPIIDSAIQKAGNEGLDVVLDGYPREIEQARWLANSGHKIDLIVVMNIPDEEIISRLKQRGRTDDTDEAIKSRVAVYRKDIKAILDLFETYGIQVANINGDAPIDDVHEVIEEVVRSVING